MSVTVTGPSSAAPDRGTPPPRSAAARKQALGLDRDAWFLVLPALIPILVLSVGPLLYGLSLAFTDAQSGRTEPTQWIGALNFRICCTTRCSGTRSGSAWSGRSA